MHWADTIRLCRFFSETHRFIHLFDGQRTSASLGISLSRTLELGSVLTVHDPPFLRLFHFIHNNAAHVSELLLESVSPLACSLHWALLPGNIAPGWIRNSRFYGKQRIVDNIFTSHASRCLLASLDDFTVLVEGFRHLLGDAQEIRCSCSI